jgi:hypothetical protein
MKKNSNSIVKLGILGALTSMVIIPAMNARARKRVTRSARNAYFRASDMVQDIRDMRR